MSKLGEKNEHKGKNRRTAGSIGIRHNHHNTDGESRTAPQYFTRICQEWRVLPFWTWSMYKVVHGKCFLPLAAQVWAQYLLARYRPLSTSLFRSYLRSKEILGNLAVKRVVHNSGIDVCNLLIKPARTKLLVLYNITQLSQVNFVEGNRHENLLFCYKTMFFHNAIILLLSFYDEQP